MNGGGVITILNMEYYGQRADEELAAAERAVDPSVPQIHREMAQRYLDMLSSHAGPVNMDSIMAEALGGAIDEQGAAVR